MFVGEFSSGDVMLAACPTGRSSWYQVETVRPFGFKGYRPFDRGPFAIPFGFDLLNLLDLLPYNIFQTI